MAASEEISENSKQGLSFGFSKKITSRKLTSSTLNEEQTDDRHEPDFVKEVGDKEVKSVKTKEEEKELVIPCIVKNTWRKPVEDKYRKSSSAPKQPQGELDSQAVTELLEDAQRQQDVWEEVKKVDSDIAIPVVVQNKLPEGYETDDKLDVSLRPDEAESADYDQVPIDQYGLAMLRGMGWKPGQGVGKNKQDCKPVESVLRPKGLGLGADKSQSLQLNYSKGTGSQGDAKNSEELILKKGTCCRISSGAHKDLYGKIEGLDDDNARVMVKLTIGGQIVTMSQYNIKLVTSTEYHKYSKYLNKGKVDKYKEEEERRQQKHDDRRKRKHDNYSSEENSHKSKDKSKESSKRSDDDSHRKHKKTSHSHSKHGRSSETNGSSSDELWIRPQIRVRIIDKHFKKGTFYNNKVVVMDVIDRDNCVVRTDEGSVLEGISQEKLETVVPKSDPAYALIVRGKYRGQIVQVVGRDKKRNKVTVQLLQDRDTALELDFDSICEYMGDIDQEFDF